MKIAPITVLAFVAASLGMTLDKVKHEVFEQSAMRIKRAPAAADQRVPVRIALKQKNLERGMQLLMELSDPDSPQYGKHYSEQKVIDTFAPDQEAIDAVKDWLVKAGVSADSITVPKSKGWLYFTSSVGKLESLLGTKYSIFHDTKTSSQFLGTELYHLPVHITNHVDFIYPAARMAKVQVAADEGGSHKRQLDFPIEATLLERIVAAPNDTSICDSVMTPACIKALHGIDGAPTSVSDRNALGVYEATDEMYLQSDLDDFYRQFSPNIPEGTGPHVDLLDWPLGTAPDPRRAGGEAALDFDMIYPIIYPQTTELYQLGNSTDAFNYFLDAIDGSYCTDDGDDPKTVSCGNYTRTNVVSISWLESEVQEQTSFMKRQCNEYMKLGLQGTTVVFASGDGGVAGFHGCDCTGDDKQVFTAIWASACPYVLSVGATELPTGSKIGDPQYVAFSEYSPGGGFSNLYERPSYQDAAVAAWFNSHDPGYPTYNNSASANGLPPPNGDNGVYNRAGRGYPDLSAVGNWGAVQFMGKAIYSGGTSMATPIIASMLTLINEDRIANGKKPVGFVNPALYKNPQMFEDVTHGGMLAKNKAACWGRSFAASEGWDPASGLGTPKYAEFAKYLKGLP